MVNKFSDLNLKEHSVLLKFKILWENYEKITVLVLHQSKLFQSFMWLNNT